MTYLAWSLLGCFWILIGDWLICNVDEAGEHDDVIMGKRPSLAHFWLAQLAWPVTLLAIAMRRS